MALTNQAKARILRRKIAAAQAEQYGHLIDHEIYTALGDTKRIAKAEAGLALATEAIKLLAAKLNALTSPQAECANERESNNANTTISIPPPQE